MDYQTIIYEKKDRTAKITFNRPEKMNAMNDVSFKEFLLALDDAENDEAVKVVVVTGKGKAFSSGVDTKFARQQITSAAAELDFLKIGKQMLSRIENLNKPVIAAINGFAIAGGFEILLASDLAIAAEDAMIGDQHMKVGMFGAGGSPYRLNFFVGFRKAKELLLTGKLLSGIEAEEIGLVNKAVPADQLDAAVEEMVSLLADKDPITMRITKMYVNDMVLGESPAKVDAAIMTSIVNNLSKIPTDK